MNVRMSMGGAAITAAAGLAVALAGCAGEGVEYAEVEKPISGTCTGCHDSEGIDELLDEINARDDSHFTEESYPDEVFPDALREKTVQDIVDGAETEEDASLDPDMPVRKAWILHEMHELKVLLAEAVPPDYTSQDTFDAFSTLGDPGAYEGCEMGTKLDLGHESDAEGMPPMWANTLFGMLGRDYEDLKVEDRQLIKDYVDRLLPGGLGGCSTDGAAAGEGSAS